MTCMCDKYNAGMLTEPVEFQRETRVADGSGGFTAIWGALAGAQEFGHIKAASGNERFSSDRVEAVSTWKLTTRYFQDVSELDAVLIRGRRYNIRFVDNIEFSDRWITFTLGLGVAV